MAVAGNPTAFRGSPTAVMKPGKIEITSGKRDI